MKKCIVTFIAKFIATVILLLSTNNFNGKEATLALMLKKQFGLTSGYSNVVQNCC